MATVKEKLLKMLFQEHYFMYIILMKILFLLKEEEGAKG
jgi:hypothetical protein